MADLTPLQSENDSLLDIAMNRLLKEGKRVVTGRDFEGNAIIGTVDPSAADLNAIRARLKDLKSGAVAGGVNATDSLLEQAEKRFGPMKFKGQSVEPLPPIAEDDDAATA